MNIARKLATITIFSTLVLSCSSNEVATEQVSITPASGQPPHRREIEQGWSQSVRQQFWFVSQGSRIIPYTWFTWLEQADSTQLFRSVEHMESLRYLPMASSDLNPAGLPIGFAIDHDASTGNAWMGLTCAACHTNQIDYKGERMLIEGAPTLANFVKFLNELIDAMNQTNSDDAKFTRFARNVLGSNASPDSSKKLRSELAAQTLALAERLAINSLPADYPEDFTSYARLDAFGNIQNAGSAQALGDSNNKNAPTAPVSYPFLWGTHQSDVVQWNGSAPNTPYIGPMVRNIGEVVGVFGGLTMEEKPWWKRWFTPVKINYDSTVKLHNLGELELWVKQLRSPRWQDSPLPKPDLIQAAKGKLIYADKCARCHEVIPREDENRDYTAVMVALNEVGTDPAMAVNASYHMSKTLFLEGTKEDVLIGKRFGETAASIDIPVNGVVGLVLKDPVKTLKAGRIAEKGSSKLLADNEINIESATQRIKKYVQIRRGMESATVKSLSLTDEPDLSALKYKARPLNGIWATAPYLHNGSVPNMTELLTRPENRAKTFLVGSREYDPKNVGYITDKGLTEFEVYNQETNTIQPGNSNMGHAYGTDLNSEQKLDLIEYIKTL